MKRLNDLRKQLPSNARLNTFESTRVKGGAEKQAPRSSADRPSNPPPPPPSDGFGG